MGGYGSPSKRLNDLPESKLERFLFEDARRSLEPAREPLLELQRGRCFYCERGIRSDPHVDHFVPWSRHPDNGLDNLVVAHQQCNISKSDHLAAAGHVARWSQHLAEHESDLAVAASELGWERDPPRTINVARAIYARLPEDVRLWQGKGEFVGLDRGVLDHVLGAD